MMKYAVATAGAFVAALFAFAFWLFVFNGAHMLYGFFSRQAGYGHGLAAFASTVTSASMTITALWTYSAVLGEYSAREAKPNG